jgi:hypothetical protein
MSRPIAVSIFASTVVAAAAFLTPQILALRLNQKIIANNEKVQKTLKGIETSSSGSDTSSREMLGDGLYGPYI